MDPNAASFQFDPNAVSFEFSPTPAPQPAQPEPTPEPTPEPAQLEPTPEPTPEPESEQPKEEEKQPEAEAEPEKTVAVSNALPANELREFEAHDEREHLNLVFIGHVDHGKSTMSGRIMVSSGQIDRRVIEKFERDAKANNRESWWIAYILDTSDEERAKGKTVEVGRAMFDTPNKRYTIFDAPGHKDYVPNMIRGASQADVGVLVVSARNKEFEAGFDRGGQTREHTLLARTIGITRLVVAVNKMDVVDWSKERYEHIVKKMSTFLKACGYGKSDIWFVPVAALKNDGENNIRDSVDPAVCDWWQSYNKKKAGLSLMQTLDSLPLLERQHDAPLRVPIMSSYPDQGKVFALGKVEAGRIAVGDRVVVSPNPSALAETKVATVVGISVDEQEVEGARCGENVDLALVGVDSSDVDQGCVLCAPDKPSPSVMKLKAQINVLELPEHKPVIAEGYTAVLHCHTAAVECELVRVCYMVDRKTGKKKRPSAALMRGNMAVVQINVSQPIAVETFEAFPQLGRFTLRDESLTTVIGRILAVQEAAPSS
ncbi:MAG: hypothetical protein MHM6MM_001852 [Cercozoa sp. M6MM]